MQGRNAKVDPLLPDVLVFPPGTDLHDHPLVKEGRLILQVLCVAAVQGGTTCKSAVTSRIR